MTLRTASYTLLLGALVGTGCGENTQSNATQSDEGIDLAVNALENPILSCRQEASDCLLAATDITSAEACQSQLGDCLSQAATELSTIAMGIETCRQQEGDCLRMGGLSGADACFSAMRDCVDALQPDGGAQAGGPGFPGLGDAGVSPPSGPARGDGGPSFPSFGDASLPTFPGLPDGGPGLPRFPGAGDAGFPSFPSVDGGFPGFGGGGPLAGGGGFPSFPRDDAGMPELAGGDCLESLRTCASEPGADLMSCARDARSCLAQNLGLPQLP